MKSVGEVEWSPRGYGCRRAHAFRCPPKSQGRRIDENSGGVAARGNRPLKSGGAILGLCAPGQASRVLDRISANVYKAVQEKSYLSSCTDFRKHSYVGVMHRKNDEFQTLVFGVIPFLTYFIGNNISLLSLQCITQPRNATTGPQQ